MIGVPMRRLLTILSVALITSGLVILLDAGLTLVWKEPLSAIYSQIRQNAASGQLEDLEASFEEDLGAGTGGDPRARIASLASRFEQRLDGLDGEAIGRIKASDAGVDQVVVEGTGTSDLKQGPGRYPSTGLPGSGRTIGIAGHRTTYGAPFRNIDKFEPGDAIEVEMPYGNLTYEVTRTEIVEPTDTQIVADRGTERLVLTACHPLYSAAKRYAVFARLAEVEPRSPTTS